MFRVPRVAAALCCGPLIAHTAPAALAGPIDGIHIALEAQGDHRQRGLSWSDGRAALEIDASVPVAGGLSLDLSAVTLRGSARHGGADLGVSVAPRYAVSASGWDFTAAARGKVFVGRAGTGYLELAGDVARTVGPARIVAGAAFAPPQDAIGGSNLYLDAQVSAGISGTALTLYGGLGHTSGHSSHGAKTARLRPGGDYLDHHLGAEYAKGPLAFGLRWSGTSISAREVDPLSRWPDRHHGSRLVAYLRLVP